MSDPQQEWILKVRVAQKERDEARASLAQSQAEVARLRKTLDQ